MLTLGYGVVDLWCVELDVNVADRREHWNLLSEDERLRANRLRTDEGRARWVVARSSLRQVLASYTGKVATGLCFKYGQNGKPALLNDESGVSFNMAHSEGLSLIGVAQRLEIGVDIERIRPLPDLSQLGRRFLDPKECDAILSTRSEREGRFFSCWTRREAVVKATGMGLCVGVDGLAVSVPPDDPARVLRAPCSSSEGKWTLTHVEPAADFVGALAVRGVTETVRLRWRTDLPR